MMPGNAPAQHVFPPTVRASVSHEAGKTVVGFHGVPRDAFDAIPVPAGLSLPWCKDLRHGDTILLFFLDQTTPKTPTET